MAKLISLRFMGTAALCSAAFVFAGVAPRLHAAPVGSGMSEPVPAMAVNHVHKGDRLPLFHPRTVGVEFPALPAGSQTQGKVSLGCDRSFSPIFRRSLGRFTAVARPDRPAPSATRSLSIRSFADTHCGIIAVLRALSILT
jgi:hypothetical protein